jgi:hypothetical protein
MFLSPVARQDELDKAVKQIDRDVIGAQGGASNLADLDRLFFHATNTISVDSGCQKVHMNSHH